VQQVERDIEEEIAVGDASLWLPAGLPRVRSGYWANVEAPPCSSGALSKSIVPAGARPMTLPRRKKYWNASIPGPVPDRNPWTSSGELPSIATVALKLR
jgi:hypothetical protein